MAKQVITAKQLIDGSDNINRMKAEICRVTSMIFSLVERTNAFVLEESFEIDDCPDEVIWKVKVSSFVPALSKFRLSATCTMPPGWGGVGYSTVDDSFKSVEAVSVVYDSLDAFVAGMLEQFPSLGQHLRPYVTAAEKRF